MSESVEQRITVVEEWHGDRRTRYILKPDGRRELLDTEIISPRPFVRILEPMEFSFKDARPGRIELNREQIEEIWPSKSQN